MKHEEIKIQVQGSVPGTHLTTYILGNYLDQAENDRRPLVLDLPRWGLCHDFQPGGGTCGAAV